MVRLSWGSRLHGGAGSSEATAKDGIASHMNEAPSPALWALKSSSSDASPYLVKLIIERRDVLDGISSATGTLAY